jgi:hypothetical protein
MQEHGCFPIDIMTMIIYRCNETTFSSWRLVRKCYKDRCTRETRISLYRIPFTYRSVGSVGDKLCCVVLSGYTLSNGNLHGIFRGNFEKYFHEVRWIDNACISRWISSHGCVIEYYVYLPGQKLKRKKIQTKNNLRGSTRRDDPPVSQIWEGGDYRLEVDDRYQRIDHPRNYKRYKFDKDGNLQTVSLETFKYQTEVTIDKDKRILLSKCDVTDRYAHSFERKQTHIQKDPQTGIVVKIISRQNKKIQKQIFWPSGYRKYDIESALVSGYADRTDIIKAYHKNGKLRHSQQYGDFIAGYHKIYHYNGKLYILQRYENSRLREMWRFSPKGNLDEYLQYDVIHEKRVYWKRHGLHIFYNRGVMYHYKYGTIVWSEYFDPDDLAENLKKYKDAGFNNYSIRE